MEVSCGARSHEAQTTCPWRTPGSCPATDCQGGVEGPQNARGTPESGPKRRRRAEPLPGRRPYDGHERSSPTLRHRDPGHNQATAAGGPPRPHVLIKALASDEYLKHSSVAADASLRCTAVRAAVAVEVVGRHSAAANYSILASLLASEPARQRPVICPDHQQCSTTAEPQACYRCRPTAAGPNRNAGASASLRRDRSMHRRIVPYSFASTAPTAGGREGARPSGTSRPIPQPSRLWSTPQR